MRTLLTLTLLTLISGQVFSESTTCIRFKLDINLVNGNKVVGDYFYWGAYMDLPDTASFEDVLLRLKNENPYVIKDPKLTIYKNVGILNYPKCWSTNLYYCLIENVIEINLSQIKNYKVIEKIRCHPESDYNEKYGYKYGGGCPPEVITELNINEVQLLANKPKIEIRTSSDYEIYFGDFCRVYLISYGGFDSTSIIMTIDDFIKDNNLSKNQNTTMTDAQYEKLKSILREKKVIMFKTYRWN